MPSSSRSTHKQGTKQLNLDISVELHDTLTRLIPRLKTRLVEHLLTQCQPYIMSDPDSFERALLDGNLSVEMDSDRRYSELIIAVGEMCDRKGKPTRQDMERELGVQLAAVGDPCDVLERVLDAMQMEQVIERYEDKDGVERYR